MRHEAALVAGLHAMGLSLYGNPGCKLPVVTCIRIPDGIVGESVRAMLLNSFGIEIASSFGPLKGQIWRIGTMGFSCNQKNVLHVLGALEAVLLWHGVDISTGRRCKRRSRYMLGRGGTAMLNIMPRAERAMIATPHYLASSVGSAILQQGGNAFDSAIAISATLGVVYPHMTGLGGDAFFLMHDAATGTYTGFNGSGKSAVQATPDFYKNKGLQAIPQRGILSAITVPGMVDAWWQVWDKYGKLPWEKLLDPAIAYAEKGFPISRNLLFWMRKDEAFIRASEQLSAVYMANGELLKEGDRLVQKDMARTLRQVQREGRDAFYKGSLMQTVVDSIQRDGGLLQEDDFRTYSGEWVKLLSTTYRGYDIYQMPPNSQGFTALMMMNMLENIEVSAVPRASANFYHIMAEVIKKAFKDRDLYLTDPHFREIPLERLLSKAYARELWNEIQAEPLKVSEHLSPAIGQDTAYAAVVDEEGNSVSVYTKLIFRLR